MPRMTLPNFEGQYNCLLDVLVPARYLSYDNEMVKKKTIWGTDIYTDDSDVVASKLWNFCRFSKLLIALAVQWFFILENIIWNSRNLSLIPMIHCLKPSVQKFRKTIAAMNVKQLRRSRTTMFELLYVWCRLLDPTRDVSVITSNLGRLALTADAVFTSSL